MVGLLTGTACKRRELNCNAAARKRLVTKASLFKHHRT